MTRVYFGWLCAALKRRSFTVELAVVVIPSIQNQAQDQEQDQKQRQRRRTGVSVHTGNTNSNSGGLCPHGQPGLGGRSPGHRSAFLEPKCAILNSRAISGTVLSELLQSG
jgi:hypothetical protein